MKHILEKTYQKAHQKVTEFKKNSVALAGAGSLVVVMMLSGCGDAKTSGDTTLDMQDHQQPVEEVIQGTSKKEGATSRESQEIDQPSDIEKHFEELYKTHSSLAKLGIPDTAYIAQKRTDFLQDFGAEFVEKHFVGYITSQYLYSKGYLLFAGFGKKVVVRLTTKKTIPEVKLPQELLKTAPFLENPKDLCINYYSFEAKDFGINGYVDPWIKNTVFINENSKMNNGTLLNEATHVAFNNVFIRELLRGTIYKTFNNPDGTELNIRALQIAELLSDGGSGFDMDWTEKSIAATNEGLEMNKIGMPSSMGNYILIMNQISKLQPLIPPFYKKNQSLKITRETVYITTPEIWDNFLSKFEGESKDYTLQMIETQFEQRIQKLAYDINTGSIQKDIGIKQIQTQINALVKIKSAILAPDLHYMTVTMINGENGTLSDLMFSNIEYYAGLMVEKHKNDPEYKHKL